MRIQTFGAVSINPADNHVGGYRTIAALVFLLIARKPVTRDELIHLLWEPGQVAGERHSLSQILYALRRKLPDGSLKGTTHYVELINRDIQLDYEEFFIAFRRGDHETATSLYQGGFLSGLPFISENFEDWRVERAAAAELAVVQAFRSLIEARMAAEQHESVPSLCTRALHVSPADEFFIRAHIESLALQGDVAGALAAYGVHRRGLLRESAVAPDWMNEGYIARLSQLPDIAPTTPDATLHIPLVGRAHELRVLRDCWRRAHSSVVAVHVYGDAGVGKSRLINHHIRRTVIDGARLHAFKCTEAEAHVPYNMIVGLLASNFRADTAGRLPATLADGLYTVAPELGSAGTTIRPSRRVVFESIAQYFAQTAATAPLVIAVDDLQWADSASLGALNYTLRRLEDQSCFVVVASRLGVPLLEFERTAALNLTRMSDHEAEVMIDYFAARRGQQCDAALKRSIVSRASGNPLFVLELLRGALDASTAAPAPVASVPDTVLRLFVSRLARMPEAARRVTATLAVINRATTVGMVAEVAGVSQLAAASAIDDLIRRGLIRNDLTCDFNHDLIRDAAYEATSVPLRCTLHQRLAAVLAARGAAASEVAHHYESGNVASEAWVFAEKACRSALDLSAYSEAEEQLKRMLRCASSDRLDATHALYVEFLYQVGRSSEALPYLSRAEAYARTRGDERVAVICDLIIFEHQHRSSTVAGEQTVRDAERLTNMVQAKCPQLLPHAIHFITEAVRGLGADDLLRSLAAMLRQESKGSAGAQRNAVAAIVVGTTEGYGAALPAAELAVALADESRDPVARVSALFARATVHLWAGNCAQSRSDYHQLLEVTEGIGSTDLTWPATSNLSIVCFEMDDIENATTYAKSALAAAAPAQRPFPLANLALFAYRMGDMRSAANYVELLAAANCPNQHHWIPAQVATLRGLLALAEDDFALAQSCWSDVQSNATLSYAMDAASRCELAARIVWQRDGLRDALVYLEGEQRKLRDMNWISASRVAMLAAKLLSTVDFRAAAASARSIAAAAHERGAILLKADAADLLRTIPQAAT